MQQADVSAYVMHGVVRTEVGVCVVSEPTQYTAYKTRICLYVFKRVTAVHFAMLIVI